MAGKKHPAPHCRREPFVSIDCYRVRQFKAGKDRAQAVGNNQCAPPSRVYVVPKPMLVSDRRALRQRVDHPCARRPGGCHDHHRHKPIPVGCEGLSERFGIHSPRSVCGDKPDGIAANACLVCDLNPGQMAVARYIENGRAFKSAGALSRKAAIGFGERTNKSGKIGLRSPIGEMAEGICRKACPLRERSHDVRFDFNRGGGGFGACELGVEDCGDPVGALRRKSGVGVE